MALTRAANTPYTTGASPRRSTGPSALGLVLVLIGAPIIGLIAAQTELSTAGIIAAVVCLLLVVLWSAEATFYVLIFSMLLSPEFIVGALEGSQATASRGVTLRLDDYIIVIIGLAWLVRLAVYKEAAVFRRTPLNAPIAAYIGIAAMSTLWGAMMDRLNLLTGIFFVLKYLEYTVIYFLVVNYVRDRDQVRRLLIAALITAAVISMVAIAQIPSGERVTAPFEGERGEPNTLGGYLVIMLALALSFLAESPRLQQRSIWLGAAAIMTLPLMYTYSRTSWLAFCAMLGTLMMVSRRRIMFLMLAGAFLLVLVVSPPESLIERAAYTLSSQRNSIQVFGFSIEPSAAARLEAWIIAGSALLAHPLVGAGVTGAGLIDAQYPRTLAETGLIGIAVFAWLLWKLAATGFELRRVATNRTERVLANGFIAGLFGMLMHGIGANTFIIVRIMEPLWLLAGLVGASLLLHREEKEGEPTNRVVHTRPVPRRA